MFNYFCQLIAVDKEYSNQLAFKHPNEFSQEYFDEEYENYFLTLIQSNIQELKAFGAVDFNLFIEAYYSDQCNFEILSPQFFHYLNKYQIRLPISVYYVPENESKFTIT